VLGREGGEEDRAEGKGGVEGEGRREGGRGRTGVGEERNEEKKKVEKRVWGQGKKEMRGGRGNMKVKEVDGGGGQGR